MDVLVSFVLGVYLDYQISLVIFLFCIGMVLFVLLIGVEVGFCVGLGVFGCGMFSMIQLFMIIYSFYSFIYSGKNLMNGVYIGFICQLGL